MTQEFNNTSAMEGCPIEVFGNTDWVDAYYIGLSTIRKDTVVYEVAGKIYWTSVNNIRMKETVVKETI